VAEVATASVHRRTRPTGLDHDDGMLQIPAGEAMIEVTLKIHGSGSVNDLAAVHSEVEGVDAVPRTT
jgi:hypothetical protein